MSPDCIEMEGVGKRYGDKVVLSGIRMHIQKGEIFGFLGPSGAGKTTLVRMIAGIDIAGEGHVNVLGTRMPKLDMMRKIGYMAQSDALYAELTAKENLEFFGALFGMKGTKLRQRMQEAVELVHLTDHLKKQVSQYSGGMKRRLSLAIALLHSPEILILDEPTVGIDPVLRRSIWQELERLSGGGTTVVVTTHVMDEAYRCHRLGMIRDGRLIACGSPDELIEETGSQTIEEAFLHYGGVRS